MFPIPDTCCSQPSLCHCRLHVSSQIFQKCTSCTISWCSPAGPTQWGCGPWAHHRLQHFTGQCFLSLCSHWVWPEETSAASCVHKALSLMNTETSGHLKVEKKFKLHMQDICSRVRASSFSFRINANKPLNLIFHFVKNKNHYIPTKSWIQLLLVPRKVYSAWVLAIQNLKRKHWSITSSLFVS